MAVNYHFSSTMSNVVFVFSFCNTFEAVRRHDVISFGTSWPQINAPLLLIIQVHKIN